MADKVYECPQCMDRGFVIKRKEDGYDYAIPCRCRDIKIAKERLINSGLAKEFTDKSFDTFEIGNNETLIDAKRTAERFVDSVNNNEVLDCDITYKGICKKCV